tara:strand:- start:1301 stop:3301 length:2001 start_codon:yes stop_codon:yes gene_type:complete
MPELKIPPGLTTEPMSLSLSAQDLNIPSNLRVFENMDQETGAPKQVRAVVSAYKKPQDKLNVLKEYYPDAIPFENDNFIFTNPTTERPTLFNPRGMDLGDVADFGRVGANILGYTAAAIPAATVSSPTIAGIPLAVAGAGATGAVAAGEAYDAALRGILGRGVEDTRTASEYGKSLVIEGGIEAVAPMAINKLFTGGKELLKKAFTNENSQKIIKASDNLEIDNLPFGVIGGKGLAKTDQALMSSPGGGNIQNLYDEGMRKLSGAVDDLTVTGQNLSKQGAGDLILNAAKKYEIDFFARSDALYKQLAKQIDPNAVFDLTKLQRVLRSNKFKFDDPKIQAELGDNTIAALSKLLDGGAKKLSYKDIAALRTNFGQQLNGTYIVGTSPSHASIKKIYGALTEDLFRAASQSGPEAFRLATVANNFYKNGTKILDDQIKPLVTQGGKKPLSSEKIYDRMITQLTKEGSRGNQTANVIFNPKLNNADQLKILGEKQFYDLTRTPRNSDFALGPTVSKLNQLRTGTGDLPVTLKALGPRVDDIETVSKGFKNAGRYANFSNTGNALNRSIMMSAIGGGSGYAASGGDIGTTAASVGGAVAAPFLLSNMLSNPASRRLIKNAATNPGGTMNPNMAMLLGAAPGESLSRNMMDDQYRQAPVLSEEQVRMLGN